LEVFGPLAFAIVLLIFRALIDIKVVGPYNFTSQNINTLPSFLKNSSEWELAYAPSGMSVFREIIENVKKNLNISMKG
jgi:hypothetical protein